MEAHSLLDRSADAAAQPRPRRARRAVAGAAACLVIGGVIAAASPAAWSRAGARLDAAAPTTASHPVPHPTAALSVASQPVPHPTATPTAASHPVPHPTAAPTAASSSAAAAAAPPDQPETRAPPHIVYVLADDMGYNDIGYQASSGVLQLMFVFYVCS